MDWRTYRQYKYVRENHHGMSWDEGLMGEDDALNLLRAAIHVVGRADDRRQVILLAKGEEKLKYLADRVAGFPWTISDNAVVDVRVCIFDGPSLKSLAAPERVPVCPVHGDRELFVCSLANCFNIAAMAKCSRIPVH